MTQKKRIIAWDFARIVLALIVIYSHLSDRLEPYGYNYTFLHVTPLGLGWGTLSVSAFFILSGAALFMTYPHFEAGGVITYYKKRMKGIMILYWITWILLFILKSIVKRSIFWFDSITDVILSMIGIGSYFGKGIGLGVGEWFIGALIILYAIYPLLLKLFNKAPKLSTVVLIIAYILNVEFHPFSQPLIRSMVTCVMCFWTGMVIYSWYISESIKRIHINTIWRIVVPWAMFVVFMFCGLPINATILMNLSGLSVFLGLWALGNVLVSNNRIAELIIKIAGASYAVFLIQHNIIYVIYVLWKPISSEFVANILIILAGFLIYGCGYMYNYVYSLLREKIAKCSALA